MDDEQNDDLQCRVCGAHATGFHFDAQSCSACCAFFRRAISLKRVYKCERGYTTTDVVAPTCNIVYTERKLCRACRLRKCFAIGMNESCVQGPKSVNKKMRAYCTSSGLRRNKRFSVISNVDMTVWRKERMKSRLPNGSFTRNEISFVETDRNDSMASVDETTSTNGYVMPKAAVTQKIPLITNNATQQKGSDTVVNASLPLFSAATTISLLGPATLNSPCDQRTDTTVRSPIKTSSPNLLITFVMEEMRIAERRKILFCERPVGSLLGNTKNGPFTANDIKPLNFHEFRRSIRIHILLIYEWLRVCPHYERLCKQDQLTFLRKSVLYHTILDPCFITLQVGDMSKFVLQNGGYVSTIESSDDGWHDELEISRDNKKKIYWPLLRRLMSDIISQMLTLNLQFEEFVAIKALVSIQMNVGRAILKQAVEEICQSLYDFYKVDSDLEKACRLGNILLLLSPIFDTATNFVESHHEVQFFDLWEIDSLLLQFLKNKV